MRKVTFEEIVRAAVLSIVAIMSPYVLNIIPGFTTFISRYPSLLTEIAGVPWIDFVYGTVFILIAKELMDK